METSNGLPRLSILIVIAITLSAGVFSLFSKRPLPLNAPPAKVSSTIPPSLDPQDSDSSLTTQRLQQKPLPPLTQRAYSLRGTVPDGELTISADELPLITPAMRRLFEYYLATLGEHTIEAIREQLYDHLQSQYSQKVADTTLPYFDRYISYRLKLTEQELQLAAMASSLPTVELLRQRLALLTEVRATELGADMAEAFFSSDTDYDHYILEKYAIRTNTTLDNEERSQALDSLNQTWPQFSQNPPLETRQRDISQHVESARSEGVSELYVYTLRSEAFGYEAAERLTALDQQREEWQQRLESYSQQKQELLASGAQEQSTVIDTLRANLFTGAELKMVHALEKLQRL